ncbi:ribonuclease inhibitor [Leptomonas pyrrhocoris]|uniref:Ribonuclease inhibitor n=1 Tax=Leptomonas pyrrhocoris TaxID=157538 RepID=A0A0M9G799_LEPPY|nr:ribonuclease inhibitor [Leptomonas pyrrhocoris]KPA83987.1 ribonuclease inhibitor [Leptomonas pyrrhocoris]|eukprot:XP_015662426.1 ribonuclease inhibitor [Leptomonas pyrrhocoris]
MEDASGGVYEDSFSSSSSLSTQAGYEDSGACNATRRNAPMMRVLLHDVLPYSRLGVLRNQLVVSPPLALVATAPAVRIYCEEYAPYSLGGTWWLAQTTTHCVVRCRVPTDKERAEKETEETWRKAGDEHGPAASYAPDGVERVFAYTRPSPSRRADKARKGGAAPMQTHVDTAGARRGGEHGEADERVCWVSAEALRWAQEQQRRDRCRGDGGSDSAAAADADLPVNEESFMARHSGTMALAPPQLCSNRRLLSFVRDAPASFLGFCTLAAQHGWQNAARALLRHVIKSEEGEGNNDADVKEEEGEAEEEEPRQRGIGPARLYVIHTQLYAICGYPESRIAYSMWWCLRRMASAVGPASLSPLRTLSHDQRLSYSAAVLPGSSSALLPSDGGEAPPVQAFMALDEGDATTTAHHLLQRYRSSQQLLSLQSVLRCTREHLSSGAAALLGEGSHSTWHAARSAPLPECTPRRRSATSEWLVTNACDLTVSGDLTFWSGTSTADSHTLLRQHWYPFFRLCASANKEAPEHAASASNQKGSPPPYKSGEGDAHATVPALATESALTAVPLPPPCALFIHGKVVLAVEHKLHRDAVHARELVKQQSARRSSFVGDQKEVLEGSQGQHPSPSTAVVVGEEEEEVVDVQPLLFDMAGDEGEEGGGSPHRMGPKKGRDAAGSAGDASALAYDPQEERFLGEIAHQQAFQLLHCVDVTYLRLPLGPELVAQRPIQPSKHARTTDNTLEDEDVGGGEAFPEDDEETEAWDAQWLSCLFPRVQVLDVEGPPSVTRAFSSPSISAATTGTSARDPGRVRRADAVAVAATAAAASAARQHLRMVRPRELTFTLGAAATSQTCTVPLYTMRGLWRLTELRRLVLRAYPFQVLPALVAAPAGSSFAPDPPMRTSRNTSSPSLHPELQRTRCETAADVGVRRRSGSDDARTKEAARSCMRRPVELSVMGWPYVGAAGLQHLASDLVPVDQRASTHGSGSGSSSAAQKASHKHENGSRRTTCAAAVPDFVMLSLTHMDSLAFVDVLAAVFPPRPSLSSLSLHSSPSLSQPTLSLARLTQLELSRTRVNTAALEHMNLPVHTPQLQVLRLSATPVDSVTSLTGLRSLRVLNLSRTRVTKGGLQCVQWMPALEELFLTQCEGLFCTADGKGAEGGRGSIDDHQGDGRAPVVNIFSLGVDAARLVSCDDVATAASTRRGCQTFPTLRVLDLSNNRKLTEHAMCYTGDDDFLSVEVTCHVREGDHSGADHMDGAPGTAPMPQLDTLYLMHTSVAHLACLLVLCPRLRTLDVSFTALREGGLWACVRCPRELPLRKRSARNTRDELTEKNAATYAVRFPAPLQLRQLNMAGVPLSSLHPLCCAPPLEWTYTSLKEERGGGKDPAGDMKKDEGMLKGPSPYSKENVKERELLLDGVACGGIRGNGCAGARAMEADVTHQSALHLYPHPAILDDRAFEVHLRTQQAWMHYAREHPHEVWKRTHESTQAQATVGCDGRLPCPVKVEDPSGYTICVDGAVWTASHPIGRPCSIDGYTTFFDAARHWIPSVLPHRVDRHPREDVADRRRDRDGPSSAVSSSSSSAADGGGFVRYGVLQLASLRQLRLGHSRITASGLAAGFGMPPPHQQQHNVTNGVRGSLVELSLRGTAYLCPPYPPEAPDGDRGGDGPVVVEMALQEQQQPQQEALLPHVELPWLPSALRRDVQATREAPAAPFSAATHATNGDASSAVPWTEAEALCAVLRLHCESLRLLDVAHTSVALATLFDCIYGEARAAASPKANASRTPTAAAASSAAVVTATEAVGNDRSDGSPLHGAIGTQWEEVLTQGSIKDAAPALTALLGDPTSVLDSHVQSCRPQRFSARAQHFALKSRTPSHHDGALDGGGIACLFSHGPAARAARRNTGGVLGLEQLRLLDVEGTPLSASLKRLFPRLYRCARSAEQGNAEVNKQQRHGRGVEPARTVPPHADVNEEGSVDERVASGSVAPGSSADQGHRGGDEDTDSDDELSENSDNVSDTALAAPPSSSLRFGPLRMRSAWEGVLHKLFGGSCCVQY